MNERRVRSVGRPTYGGRPQQMARPKRRMVRWSGLSSLQRRLLVLAAGLVLVMFWLSQAFAIRQVVVQSQDGASGIQTVVQTLVQSSFLSSNLLTVNVGTLSAKLQQADPALRGAQFRRQWPHTLVVVAQLQQPSLGWSTDGAAYLLDRSGGIIGPLPSGSRLPVVTDGSNLPVSTGKQVVSPAFVTFVQALVPGLSAEGYTVTGMNIKDTTYDLTVATNKHYSLIFDTTRSVTSELADLKAVQGVLTAQKQTPSNYIDLRIAGKAYYK